MPFIKSHQLLLNPLLQSKIPITIKQRKSQKQIIKQLILLRQILLIIRIIRRQQLIKLRQIQIQRRLRRSRAFINTFINIKPINRQQIRLPLLIARRKQSQINLILWITETKNRQTIQISQNHFAQPFGLHRNRPKSRQLLLHLRRRPRIRIKKRIIQMLRHNLQLQIALLLRHKSQIRRRKTQSLIQNPARTTRLLPRHLRTKLPLQLRKKPFILRQILLHKLILRLPTNRRIKKLLPQLIRQKRRNLPINLLQPNPQTTRPRQKQTIQNLFPLHKTEIKIAIIHIHLHLISLITQIKRRPIRLNQQLLTHTKPHLLRRPRQIHPRPPLFQIKFINPFRLRQTRLRPIKTRNNPTLHQLIHLRNLRQITRQTTFIKKIPHQNRRRRQRKNPTLQEISKHHAPICNIFFHHEIIPQKSG